MRNEEPRAIVDLSTVPGLMLQTCTSTSAHAMEMQSQSAEESGREAERVESVADVLATLG